ncbi:hypothetical protein UFOVP1492_21 [uncultured Caudovirales phage]|uniref:Uncharacterized protein n=1 Tax=uncultured Caudovirales phage TaxID=2100421 RepID=A0A6J5SPX4_9CAUD|nr:hypothetical protein UFOVP1127_113 [uncultured Caudovirales phage]CAB4193530.1 hypothetical protein UFOVP1242_97 [uncultured Caudovirales phage]CAB4217309.1 hypothetical protein UFOVP1492_21 [uncultured Caudovirales phage]CAB5231282.1 hypothetical protein UFOVP1580_50 [uncultured Caudovirales phage]
MSTEAYKTDKVLARASGKTLEAFRAMALILKEGSPVYVYGTTASIVARFVYLLQYEGVEVEVTAQAPPRLGLVQFYDSGEPAYYRVTRETEKVGYVLRKK